MVKANFVVEPNLTAGNQVPFKIICKHGKKQLEDGVLEAIPSAYGCKYTVSSSIIGHWVALTCIEATEKWPNLFCQST